MKKVLFIIVLFMLCPIVVFGKTYEIKDYGITISFDKNWDIFTRESDRNSSFLLIHDLDYDYMQDLLRDNLIYLYAINEINDDSNIEFLFLTNGNKAKRRLTEEEFEKFAVSVADSRNVENYEIYESNYKYIKYDYFDADVGLYFIEYVLHIDFTTYFFTARKESEFTDDEISQVENVIDSITVSGDGIQYVEGASNDETAGTKLSERQEFIIDFIVKFVFGVIAFTILKKTILNKDYMKKKFFKENN